MMKSFMVELVTYILIVYMPFILWYGFFALVGLQWYLPGLAFRVAFGLWFIIWHVVMAIQLMNELTGDE